MGDDSELESVPRSSTYYPVFDSAPVARWFRRRFSDHAPVWTRFAIDGVDDD